MARKPKKEVVEEVTELADNEEYISRDDLGIEVFYADTEEDGPVVYVKFEGFDDEEEAQVYADMLADTLPLLLFETTKLQ